jgi:predicted nucleic acid-binding protein
MTSKSILLDTSAVIALLDIGDAYHEAIEPYWQEYLLLPITLLAEVD